MGRVKHDWQDTNYVLARFSDSGKEARKSYLGKISVLMLNEKNEIT